MQRCASKALSIYVHYPYCAQICSFCAFNKYKKPTDLDHTALAGVYKRELDYVLLEHARNHSNEDVSLRSLYFGGGTPSLAPNLVADIIAHVKKQGITMDGAEVTLEANPSSLPNINLLHDIGVTRVSLGVQSLVNDSQLREFNREHSASQSITALNTLARNRSLLKDGFSFDLMFANPLKGRRKDVTGKSIRDELIQAIPYAQVGGHLSTYELTLEQGTPLARDVKAGILSMPSQDQAADEYETAVDVMAQHGFDHYEVSSFALPQHYGRHNFAFWMHEDLIGIGPGAHGRITGRSHRKYRTRCIPDPKRWASQVESLGHGRARTDRIDASFAEECIAVGLRTETGVSRSHFQQTTKQDLERFLNMDQVKFLQAEGYLEHAYRGSMTQSLPEPYRSSFVEGYLRATEKGRRLLDMITPMILL